ncbi:MAG: PD-(D/E)XK nuclease family protein [Vampirovibrionales bacterium]
MLAVASSSLTPTLNTASDTALVLNASMLQAWLTCERQALYHYILKLPAPVFHLPQEAPASTSGRLGHASLGFWASGVWQHAPSQHGLSNQGGSQQAFAVMATWLLAQLHYTQCLEQFEVASYEILTPSSEGTASTHRSMYALQILRECLPERSQAHPTPNNTLEDTPSEATTLLGRLTERIPLERSQAWNLMLKSFTTEKLTQAFHSFGMPQEGMPVLHAEVVHPILTISENPHSPLMPLVKPWESLFWQGVVLLGDLPEWQRHEDIGTLLRIFSGCLETPHGLPLDAPTESLHSERWIEARFPEWQHPHPVTGEPVTVKFRGQMDLLHQLAPIPQDTDTPPLRPPYELFEFKFSASLFKTQGDKNQEKLEDSLRLVKDADASATESAETRTLRYGLSQRERLMFQLPLYAYALETTYQALPEKAHLIAFRDTSSTHHLALPEDTTLPDTMNPLLTHFQTLQEKNDILSTTSVVLHEGQLAEHRHRFLTEVYEEVIRPMLSGTQTFAPRPHKRHCPMCQYRMMCDAFHQHLAG